MMKNLFFILSLLSYQIIFSQKLDSIIDYGSGNVEFTPVTQLLEIDSLLLGRVSSVVNDSISLSLYGIPDGRWVSYFKKAPSILALEFTIKNNKLEGTYIRYYENGNFKSILRFVEGEIDGVAYYFSRNGKLQYVKKYIEGIVQEGVVCFDKKKKKGTKEN